MEELILIITFMSFSVICMGIMIPVAIKWGVEKARTGFSIGFGMIAGIVWFSVYNSDDPAGILNWLEAPEAPVMLVGLAMVVWVLGYLIGCRLYRKKEF
ncbi:MAG: ABC-2 transporter permease [Lachnospiraceae bacterium]|nr:ABC-2 transporter permease [Lachnospiraceae bacterium]